MRTTVLPPAAARGFVLALALLAGSISCAARAETEQPPSMHAAVLPQGPALSPTDPQPPDGLAGSGGRTVTLSARYSAYMGGLPFGSMTLDAEFAPGAYRAGSLIRTEGLADLLLRQIFDLRTEGQRTDRGFATRAYNARNTDRDEVQLVGLAYDAAGAPTVAADPPYDNSDRVPVAEHDLVGTVDPLSAVIVAQGSAGPEACARAVPVYDGRRRYDFRLSYAGMTTLEGSGYSGPVVRCRAELVPIGGYKADSLREMREDPARITLWLGEVPGADALVPVRFEVETALGTLVSRATYFEVTRKQATREDANLRHASLAGRQATR